MSLKKKEVNSGRWFPARITSLSNLKVINNIRDNLSQTQLKIFRDTCFGHFLDLQEFEFCGQMIHSVLLHKQDEGLPGQLQCRIGGQLLTFGPVEFALITGLNFGPDQPIDNSSSNLPARILRFFEGSERITLAMVEAVMDGIKEEESNNNEPTEHDTDMVRLALLYVVECLLLGKERRNKVDNRIVKLTDDIEAFNKWPWGKMSLERLMATVHKKIPHMESKKSSMDDEKTKVHYGIHGFPLALQIWAYESIPMMGNKYGLKSFPNKYPRMLRWASRGCPTFAQCEFIRRKEVKYLKYLCLISTGYQPVTTGLLLGLTSNY